MGTVSGVRRMRGRGIAAGLAIGLISSVLAGQPAQAGAPAPVSASGPARAVVAGPDLASVVPLAGALKKRQKSKKRRAIFVGNNWDGTADVLDPRTLRRLGTLNVIPDYAERMREIMTNPYDLGYFLAIRTLIGEGHDQFVDDMYSSNNGKLVVISRPSFADVVAISLKTKKIVWRFEVAGERSDHMAISPDGKTVVVSASTGNVVHALRVRDGKEVGRFASGGSPHENVYIDGGKRILHASIGMVYSPLDDPALDATKDERVFMIVNAKTYKVERRYDLRKALDDRGLTKVSTAVRPLTLSPDEKRIYFQVSFFHGYLQMSRRTGKITHVRRLPNLVPNLRREEYLLDSAHHGIAANPDGDRICVAGTMSDYAVVVDVKSRTKEKLVKRKNGKPYWVTPSADGRFCLISWSGTDQVSKISYRTGKVVRNKRVGDHPQRVRNGFIRKGFVKRLGINKPTLAAIP
ncbi:YncE family protein [Nocardioides salsibiostraticola]